MVTNKIRLNAALAGLSQATREVKMSKTNRDELYWKGRVNNWERQVDYYTKLEKN